MTNDDDSATLRSSAAAAYRAAAALAEVRAQIEELIADIEKSTTVPPTLSPKPGRRAPMYLDGYGVEQLLEYLRGIASIATPSSSSDTPTTPHHVGHNTEYPVT